MKSIALTGGIACGKSLFGRLLSEEGVETMDADDLVHALHEPHGKGALAVAAEFGPDYLRPDGSTDRARLGNLVFADPSAKARLEAIVHPLVRQSLLDWKNSFPRPAFRVAQIPLLFQMPEWRGDWDVAVTVEAPEELRFERLCARGLSPEQACARIASQLSSAERTARADYVVQNNAGIEELRALARQFLATLGSTHP